MFGITFSLCEIFSTFSVHFSEIFFIFVMRILMAHLQSSVFKLSKDLIDSIHEEGIVAYTS